MARKKDANYQILIKKQREKIYHEKIKELRPYLKRLRNIDLRHKLTSSQKALVTKAWDEYQELTVRPHKIYRPQIKEHLNIAQEFARHEKGAIKFDVAFIPTADPKAKIKFTKIGIKIISKYVTETVLFFNMKELARNPEAEIKRTLEKNPNAKRFVIMAGKYLWNGGLQRDLVETDVLRLMAKYSQPKDNHFYANWLFGVVAAEFKNQQEFNDYRKSYDLRKEQIKTRKKNIRRQRGYKYGEKF